MLVCCSRRSGPQVLGFHGVCLDRARRDRLHGGTVDRRRQLVGLAVGIDWRQLLVYGSKAV